MSNKTYSTTDRLSSKARSGAGEQGSGGALLDGIVILSAILSAIFFWTFSQSVFVNVYPPVALLLGLIVGLMPAEGAFFGWKRVRATKTNLTTSQLSATKWGLVTAVLCSVFSTIALFVATVPFVPADIAAYADWLVFLSLAIPTPLQVCIIAYYSINERATVENHERAKLQALGFDAWVKAEAARMQSIIDGINIALDKQLEGYGQKIGAQEASDMLSDGGQQLLQMGQPTHPNQRQQVNGRFYHFDQDGNGTDGHGRIWFNSEAAARASAREWSTLWPKSVELFRQDGKKIAEYSGFAGGIDTMGLGTETAVNPTQRYNGTQGD